MRRTLYVTLLWMTLGLFAAPQAAGQAPVFVDDDNVECPQAAFSSIQAAVDAASAGDTIIVCPGTYVNERVVLTAAKNNMQFIAVGRPGTVILDGTNPSPTFNPPNHGFLLNGASGVLIQGFSLTRYFEEIKLINASNNTIRANMTTAAGHDGINLVGSSGNLIEHNFAFDNLSPNACGINLVLSPNNTVRHNVLTNNNWGILLNGSNGNTLFSNVAVNNRSHGILNRASSGTTIENNRVNTNGVGAPSSMFPEGPRAGIGVQRNQFTGVLSNNVTVARNRSFNNMTVDLFWDQQGAGNVFDNNHCTSSDPGGLCRPEGQP